MTGPEHYLHAQALLDMASEDEAGSDIERYRLAAAQVHATLALAAATAFSPHTLNVDIPEHKAWRAAAFTKEPGE